MLLMPNGTVFVGGYNKPKRPKKRFYRYSRCQKKRLKAWCLWKHVLHGDRCGLFANWDD